MVTAVTLLAVACTLVLASLALHNLQRAVRNLVEVSRSHTAAVDRMNARLQQVERRRAGFDGLN